MTEDKSPMLRQELFLWLRVYATAHVCTTAATTFSVCGSLNELRDQGLRSGCQLTFCFIQVDEAELLSGLLQASSHGGCCPRS
jgi:hypothetical protein